MAEIMKKIRPSPLRGQYRIKKTELLLLLTSTSLSALGYIALYMAALMPGPCNISAARGVRLISQLCQHNIFSLPLV